MATAMSWNTARQPSPGTAKLAPAASVVIARMPRNSAMATQITERPIHEVTVLAIMERTTLSRKSFYVYFRDRSELILALVRPLRPTRSTPGARPCAPPPALSSARLDIASAFLVIS
jgi:AcrR family transcriptional regulator